MQCLSASESSIWALLGNLGITATLFQGLCTMNEAKPRKRNFTHKQTIFTHNRIRGTHSKIFYKQYLDLFLPIADIPESFDINTSPTMCVYGYTVYYRITLVSCRDKQNSQLYFSIWQKHLIKHLWILYSYPLPYEEMWSRHYSAVHDDICNNSPANWISVQFTEAPLTLSSPGAHGDNKTCERGQRFPTLLKTAKAHQRVGLYTSIHTILTEIGIWLKELRFAM